MPQLNLERLDEFHAAWMQKANQARVETVAGMFDRFFALWIVYNRLYVEIAFKLASDKHPLSRVFGLQGRRRFAPSPDRMAATKVICAFCGPQIGYRLRNSLEISNVIEATLNSVEFGGFYLHENYETGEPDLHRDRKIISNARKGDVLALLELVYQARCNLFHGQKAYSETQRPLIEGMSSVLVVAIEEALSKLRQRN